MDLLWETVCTLIVLLVIGAVGFLYHAGYFSKVSVSVGTPMISNVQVCYKFHVGHYSACGPHFEELVRLCPELRCLGIFYDDPKQAEKLSSHPYLEIYEDKLIHYMAPLSKHEEFYVDEVKDMLKQEEN